MNIEKLLAKSVLGILTTEEENALQQWREENPAHEAYWRKLRQRRNYSELYQAYRASNHQQMHTVRRFNWKRVIGYAAVWTLPIIMVLGVWMTFSTPERVDEIVPGSPKATLCLENGTLVELGDSRELGWIRINDDFMASDLNGCIEYEATRKVNTELKNTLNTPRGGEYRITLPDGTRIHLNSLSELTYPICFDEDKREVTLTGEAYFEVAHDAKRPFIVKANGLSIKQYGTRFSVYARSPQTVVVALEEGSVGVSTPAIQEQLMCPGQIAVWDKTAENITLSETNLEPYTAWHRNRFVFEGESLGQIMETLSLWYDLDVRFQDVRLAELHFTGNVNRYEDITVILRAIESTIDVECLVKGRQVRIKRK